MILIYFSPFGTGNETFGLSPVFKRAAAITGDVIFGVGRRELSQIASRQGRKVYAYLFCDPQVNSPLPYLGGENGSISGSDNLSKEDFL